MCDIGTLPVRLKFSSENKAAKQLPGTVANLDIM